MNIKSLILLVSFFMVATVLSVNASTAGQQGLSPENLSFQADIYGGPGQETIEYLSDLNFHGFGGFGTNAHIYRASLQSGDQIAYAVSANDPYAFSLHVTPDHGDPVTLTVTNNDYSAGVVTMPSANELHFTWEIEQSGLHVNLHRRVTLENNSQVNAQYVIREVFAVENLGTPFTLDTFSEYLHLDDRAYLRDYDCDGVSETLIAINSYSSDGYPVFGKLYAQQKNLHTQMSVNGNYTTVENFVYLPLATGNELEILTANYVSSTAKNGSDAEQQVTNDIRTLLGGQFDDRWLVRSHNTDDRGAVFVNGLMVAGSRYSLYPDSGWVDVCKHWNNEGNTYVSFASWDLGGCCNATWGFGLKRNDEILWSEVGSGSTSLGITYSKILSVTQSGEVTEYEQIPPATPLDGDWEIMVSANGGFAFGLVDNLPVAGSTYNNVQTINISDLLGEQDNHIHLNTWNDGGGTHEWHFAIKRNDETVWETSSQIEGGQRGLGYYKHLIITADGEVQEILNVPLLLQTSPPWESYPYGRPINDNPENTISGYGCFMTSAAMIINYWGKQSDFDTNPGIFNSWLRAYEGYDPDNGVIWGEIENYTEINDVSMSFDRISRVRNDSLLDATINSGNPAIIGVNLNENNDPGHYVVVAGKTTANGHPTYSINDPIHGQTTLYAQYNNNYSRIYTFDNSSDDRRLLSISAHSPVELLITDPYGRKEGYDPTTGLSWDEIPEAEYFANTLAPNGGSGTGNDVLESIVFLSTTPLDGRYTITVFGVGNGSYQLVIAASTWSGKVEQVTMNGNASDGSTDIFEINYDPYSGIGDTIFLPIILK